MTHPENSNEQCHDLRSDILQLHSQRNQVTRHCRVEYSSHRSIVTSLLLAAADRVDRRTDTQHQELRCAVVGNVDGDASTADEMVRRQKHPADESPAKAAIHHGPVLMVLGAGNCLDLDLNELAGRFSRIHLVDMDVTALQSARDHHPHLADQLRLHAPIDLAWPLCCRQNQEPSGPSGESDHETNQRDTVVDPCHDPEAWCRQLASASFPSKLPVCDVVASVCLFTQMVDTLSVIPGVKDALTGPAIQALRTGHFRRMLMLCRSVSGLVFITDLVSSDTAPCLLQDTGPDLPTQIRGLLRQGNLFAGCHPDRVARDLWTVVKEVGSTKNQAPERGAISPQPANQPEFSNLQLQLTPPWRWQLGPRCFACYGIGLVEL